jgi:hypothetical protein
VNILRHICPLLRNGSVNTFPKNTLLTIQGHPLLGNGPINTDSRQQKTVFSVGSVPRTCRRAQSVANQTKNCRSTTEYNGVQSSSNGVSNRKSWQCVRWWFVNCCIINHANPPVRDNIVACLRHANLETCSRCYATVNEAVFSPCRAELCRVVPSRASPRPASQRRASPRLLLSDSYKHLDDARVRMGHITSACSAVTQQ